MKTLLLLGLLNLFSTPALAESFLTAVSGTEGRSRSPQPHTQLPPRPPTTPPPNTVRSGGSLSGSSTCVQLDKPVVALVPVQNPVLTTTPHPTFLFYVPYSASEIQYGEFSVLSYPGEMIRVYRTRFTLPQRPGIVSITLPDLPAHALEENQTYHWYLKLYCNDAAGNGSNNASSTNPNNSHRNPSNNRRSRTADLEVDGFVQRVGMTTERDRQIQMGTPEVWYDALANAANQLNARPQDSLWRDRWRTLLQSINAGNLADIPLSGAITPTQ